jgi:hypothetical protein
LAIGGGGGADSPGCVSVRAQAADGAANMGFVDRRRGPETGGTVSLAFAVGLH